MFKVLVDGCEPKRATKYSAFVDLFASEDVVIGAGETAMVGLGVRIDEEVILDGIHCIYINQEMLTEHKLDQFYKTHYLQLEPRSSLRAKGLIAGTGVIDLDFKLELKIILHNSINFVDVNDSFIADDTDDVVIGVSKFDVELFGACNELNQNNLKDGEEIVSSSSYVIKKGDKIAQIALMEHKSCLMGYESEEERTGGFGSTGDTK